MIFVLISASSCVLSKIPVAVTVVTKKDTNKFELVKVAELLMYFTLPAAVLKSPANSTQKSARYHKFGIKNLAICWRIEKHFVLKDRKHWSASSIILYTNFQNLLNFPCVMFT